MAEAAARLIIDGRPAEQVAAIARQLAELAEVSFLREKWGSARTGRGHAAGGRLRIVFMHLEMVAEEFAFRYAPIGAGAALAQRADRDARAGGG